MKNKVFTLLSLSIFALVMIAGMASAATTYTETFANSSATGSYGDDSFLGDNSVTWTFVNSKDAETYAISDPSLQFDDTTSKLTSDTISGGIASFSVKLAKATTSTGDRQVELYINGVLKATSTAFDDDSIHTFSVSDLNIEGDFTIEIRNIQDDPIVIDDITWTSYTAEVEPEEVEGCTLADDGDDLQIDIDDISVTGFGGEDEDTDWFPLDEIEVEVEITNNNDEYEIEDIELHWGLYNKDTGKWYIDEKEDDFDLDEDEDETITITFSLDDDIDELADGDYVFYVWTEEAVLDDSSDTPLCAYDYEEIDIIIEDEFVILYDIEFPDEATAGDDVTLTAEVWNVGEEEQEDVYIIIYNADLEVREIVEIGDIDEFEDADLSYTFELPSDAEEGYYTFSFFVIDEDDDVYENDYDDDESVFYWTMYVESSSATPKVTVSASLESEAVAGSELIIQATIVNTGSSTETFQISLTDYGSWATLGSVTPASVTLDAGQSQDVLITLNVNSGVSGSQSFEVLVSEGSKILTQPVSVTISGSGLSGITGNLISGDGDSWPIWVIGAVNLVLVLIIVIVAVRMSRK